MLARRLAANHSFHAFGVHAVDARRTAVAVTDREGWLRLLDGETLTLRRGWHVGEDAVGTHAVRAGDEFALVSGVDSVTLLPPAGGPVWTFRHDAPWQQGGFQRGCAWFDAAGEAFAIVPRPGYDGCDIVHLGRRDGRPLERVRIDTDPAGAEAVHHRDGWVGLSVGEGQDGAFAWWTRLGARGPELIEAPWGDEVLFDVDPAGAHVLTTPHDVGPIRVRTFPGLGLMREIDPPADTHWDFYACFAGEHIVARAHTDADEELLLAIGADGTITTLASSPDPIVPGPAGSWLTITDDGLERWTLTPPRRPG